MTDVNKAAELNLMWLRSNEYPGRGMVVGLSQNGGHLVQVYFLTGRRENSQSRVFKQDVVTGRVYTEASDPSKVTDPTNVIYNAMREVCGRYIVSNGNQTDTVADFATPSHLQLALGEREYEHDPPIWTPRITAISFLNDEALIKMSILRKSEAEGECDRPYFEIIPHPGFGHCITTYAANGEPPPVFRGNPLVMPLRGGPQEVADMYWDSLPRNFRVALAVKFIERSNGRSFIHLINTRTQKA